MGKKSNVTVCSNDSNHYDQITWTLSDDEDGFQAHSGRVSHTPPMANWDRYGRQGVDLALSASSFGFFAAKYSTRLGVSWLTPVLAFASHVASSSL